MLLLVITRVGRRQKYSLLFRAMLLGWRDSSSCSIQWRRPATPLLRVVPKAVSLSPPQVCGLAVLGKENIMRHAAEQHEGRGAYQCQYCKKVSIRMSPLACMTVFWSRPARSRAPPSQGPPPPRHHAHT
ncbi:hypothetical protein E2C01_004792 [Portunus trituberculatus]|uniref:Uncharacterized protein n=1 Tax=Portunus trituberculatus TaxID=210409 RepID=A0A5B7CTY4_PORTR|nr:hypothetical protein [Portunus trituberculatus]